MQLLSHCLANLARKFASSERIHFYRPSSGSVGEFLQFGN
jgi:hypothetical protein